MHINKWEKKILTGQLKTWMPRVRDGDREDGSRTGTWSAAEEEDALSEL